MRNNKIKAALCALLFSFFGFATVESECSDMTEKQDQQCTEVRAEHILIETESQANEILQEINDGKISFEDAAKKSSKCPSGKQGGDLGYFGRGAMVKEFEEAAFSTAKGKISAPVKTQFGWHLIKVIDKR